MGDYRTAAQITRQGETKDYEKKEFLRQYLKELREEALTTGEGREFQRGTTLTKNENL